MKSVGFVLGTVESVIMVVSAVVAAGSNPGNWGMSMLTRARCVIAFAAQLVVPTK